jgi:signal transduction histidine kinase
VLFNLLTNAAHFTAPGTPVRLTVRRSGSNAEIRVIDQGPGIGEEARGRLFQPFFTTRGKEGTGIGLWLSKEMIERAGGRLVFYSEPTLRPGTEFVATLPFVN